jgi:hypothetical protein
MDLCSVGNCRGEVDMDLILVGKFNCGCDLDLVAINFMASVM